VTSPPQNYPNGSRIHKCRRTPFSSAIFTDEETYRYETGTR
jgi:hypothetical protein